jgi:Protein of unknown function (DUF3574)
MYQHSIIPIKSALAWQKSFHQLFIVSILFITPSCSHILANAQPQASQSPALNSEKKIFVKDELYFGLSKPAGIVSETEWQQFLSGVITPRFQAGLTVKDAYGQYMSKSGTINQEKTKIVILIYENSSAKNRMVEESIANYKRTFQQESVLRVTSSVNISF